MALSFCLHCVQSSPEARACLHKKINFCLLKVRPETLLHISESSIVFPSFPQCPPKSQGGNYNTNKFHTCLEMAAPPP